ncbi:hypothetical protein RIF29_32468 [Crotalaria pallida]|uniref:Uncharacterized protein n=1 Tax=Crotalaria pallida TaxID=3830 RepID=A0AAN9ENG1_CROPI
MAECDDHFLKLIEEETMAECDDFLKLMEEEETMAECDDDFLKLIEEEETMADCDDDFLKRLEEELMRDSEEEEEGKGEEEQQQHHQQPQPEHVIVPPFKCETLEMARELAGTWTRDEYDEAFKRAFVNYPNRWDIIATLFPPPWSPPYMKHCFENMNYQNFITELAASSHRTPSRFLPVEEHTPPAVPTTPPRTQEHTPPVRSSKKRTRWNEDEHRLFVEGLAKYGRGDWISISKYLLPSRTPSQIASHAQKYFIRQDTCAARKKRRSIHDASTSGHAAVLHGADSQNCTQQQQQTSTSDHAVKENCTQQQQQTSTSDHAAVLDGADNQNCTQQQQQTSDHAVVPYDAYSQNCLPPLPHDWNFIPCDIATQQQQPSTSNNFLSSQMDGCGIGDMNTEEEVSQVLDYFNSIPALPDSEFEHIQFSGLQQEEQGAPQTDHLNPPSTSNNFLSSQQQMDGRGIGDMNTEEESQVLDYFNSIPALPDSELENIEFSLLLNDLQADDNLSQQLMDDAFGGISETSG